MEPEVSRSESLESLEALLEEDTSPSRPRLAPRIRQVIHGATIHPDSPLGGFTLSRCREEDHSLELTLERAGERLTLWLRPLSALPSPFLEGRRLALYYGEETPIDTQEKRLVAARVLRLVERVVPADWSPRDGASASRGE